ncbi:unnamed protein product [Chrysodeixis includens]|uniref:Uncharacterized protein n=1 Tax=Chrysodeixis includens TaxID=689277 RepID=A0A9P0BN26_CHRIL|nr:unnamed protein product [Chrysodeixis includens]
MSYLRESWLRPLVTSGDMLRNKAFVVLTTLSFISRISSEYTIYSNGWIPLTHNDIYNQIRRQPTQYPDYVAVKPALNSNNLLAIVQDTKDEMENLIDGNRKILHRKFPHTSSNVGDSSIPIAFKKKENIREAKLLSKQAPDFYEDNIIELPQAEIEIIVDKTETDTSTNKMVSSDTRNTYEVTEDTDKLFNKGEDETSNDTGYQYTQPIETNHNLTSNFYEILSKYNINSEDQLSNYDLSLQRKAQNPLTKEHRVPIPYRYNSLNHLPVDPLLAVFLSNYGLYLPSLYGIKSNYNNLYGYLASNNIHNNKPFGLYKIFSDTDSWN